MTKLTDYIVVIPSYDRAEICRDKTLTTLKNQNIKPNRINIFVANKEQYDIYQKVIPKDLYNKMIIGVLGIANQRNFINDYYNENQYIVSIDDDIEEVFKGDKNTKKKDIIDLNNFFNNAYKELIKTNLKLWGVLPVANPYFSYHTITKDLRLIAGGLYGTINDKSIKRTINEKEDFEYTLLHYIKYGGVLRFNDILMKTQNYSKGGIVSSVGSKEQRKKDSIEVVKILKEKYSKYGDIKIRSNGINEFVLKRKPKLEGGKKSKDSLSDYIVAVPSYDRVEKCRDYTLTTLKNQNIKADRINIFVANKEQYDIYQKAIPKDMYNEMIIGVIGLINQRKFINDYYKENQYLINIDDDIKEVYKAEKTSKKKDIIDLNKFFNDAYNDLKKNNLGLWGISSTTNHFFTTDSISTDLRLIRGGLFGYINDKSLVRTLDAVEDREFTILHYIKYGGVIRYNNIMIDTELFTEGGMDTYYKGEKKRREKETKDTLELFKRYPEYGKIKIADEGGKYYNLIKNPKLEGGKKSKDSLSDYIVVIPSYDRPEECKNKSLTTLKNQNIKPDRINIFVANKEQYDIYQKVIPKDMYNKMIIGEKGINNQRNFIKKYYNENQYIVSIDDDIEKVYKAEKTSKKEDILDLNKFFNDAYDNLKKNNFGLWGISSTTNHFFSYDKITTDLRFIVGVLFGMINHKSLLTNIDIGEDTENTILYYKKYGGVIRYNNILAKTKYQAKGGVVGFYEGKDNRAKKTKEITEILLKRYPEYFNFKHKKDGTKYLILIKNPKLEGGKIPKDKVDFSDFQSDVVIRDTVSTEKTIKDLQTEILDLLNNTKIPRIEQKRKDGKKTRGDLLGYTGDTFNMGIGYRRNLGLSEFSANAKNPELFKKLVEYGNEILPTGFKYNVITVNRNLKAKKHIDKGNTGFSCITFLGDYTGGGLIIYKDGKKEIIPSHNKLILMNGSLMPHQTEDFKGTRYALIYYSQNPDAKIKNVKMEGK